MAVAKVLLEGEEALTREAVDVEVVVVAVVVVRPANSGFTSEVLMRLDTCRGVGLIVVVDIDVDSGMSGIGSLEGYCFCCPAEVERLGRGTFSFSIGAGTG